MSNELTEHEIAYVQTKVNAWFDKKALLEPENPNWLKSVDQPDGHPILRPDWDWSGKPTPTFLWEACPIDDWVHYLAYELNQSLVSEGLFLEPYASYALSLYRWN